MLEEIVVTMLNGSPVFRVCLLAELALPEVAVRFVLERVEPNKVVENDWRLFTASF